MRIGENPLKSDVQKLEHKQHRIILPFWIPDIINPYFRNQPEVLRHCLQSLSDTINHASTNITLINNNSCPEASEVAESFVAKGVIDKYVVLSENRGKLETVLAEARASYEEFVTIADGDFLFMKGWEKSVADIMRALPSAGMVTCFPTAHLGYFYNSNSIWFPLKAGKIVDDKDIDLFEQGIGHSASSGLYSKTGFKRKYSWRQRHYYIERKGCTAVVGAVHALATYRRAVVEAFSKKPVELRFGNGYEHDYIDFASEKSGFLRVSTPKLMAYHMGNTLPDEVEDFFAESKYNDIEAAVWPINQKSRRAKFLKILFPMGKYVFRLLRKLRII